MRTGIRIEVTASDLAGLEALVAAGGSPQKHVWRARIILLMADGLGTVAVMAATGKSKTCVWRWQERFMAEGIDGLLRDKTRPPGIAPLAPALVEKVVALTLEPPDHEATHWTVRAMAKAVGIAASSVVKIWHDHGLAPQAQLQAVQRQGVCREAARRSRPLRLAAGPCDRAVGRRKEPDPGARPHAARAASQAWAWRDHDARLHTPRFQSSIDGGAKVPAGSTAQNSHCDDNSALERARVSGISESIQN